GRLDVDYSWAGRQPAGGFSTFPARIHVVFLVNCQLVDTVIDWLDLLAPCYPASQAELRATTLERGVSPCHVYHRHRPPGRRSRYRISYGHSGDYPLAGPDCMGSHQSGNVETLCERCPRSGAKLNSRFRGHSESWRQPSGLWAISRSLPLSM